MGRSEIGQKASDSGDGIANIQWTPGFERTFHRLMAEADALYLNDNPHARAKITVETRTARENAALREKYPELRNRTLGTHFIQLACDQITGRGGTNAACLRHHQSGV